MNLKAILAGLFLIIIIAFILTSGVFAQDGKIDARIRDLIREATFEIIIKKPEKDSLSYERPLPLDLLPYSIRTDKYYSIGTAFAISEKHLLSAAHV